jgi:hypothetical protein
MTWTTVRDERGRLHWVVTVNPETLELARDDEPDVLVMGCAVCGPVEREDGKCPTIVNAEKAGPI